MKVGLLCTTEGGAGRSARQIAKHCSALGYDTQIFTSSIGALNLRQLLSCDVVLLNEGFHGLPYWVLRLLKLLERNVIVIVRSVKFFKTRFLTSKLLHCTRVVTVSQFMSQALQDVLPSIADKVRVFQEVSAIDSSSTTLPASIRRILIPRVYLPQHIQLLRAAGVLHKAGFEVRVLCTRTNYERYLDVDQSLRMIEMSINPPVAAIEPQYAWCDAVLCGGAYLESYGLLVGEAICMRRLPICLAIGGGLVEQVLTLGAGLTLSPDAIASLPDKLREVNRDLVDHVGRISKAREVLMALDTEAEYARALGSTDWRSSVN